MLSGVTENRTGQRAGIIKCLLSGEEEGEEKKN
jgi:hypothetical protein